MIDIEELLVLLDVWRLICKVLFKLSQHPYPIFKCLCDNLCSSLLFLKDVKSFLLPNVQPDCMLERDNGEGHEEDSNGSCDHNETFAYPSERIDISKP
jgi:hypothetical protein